MKRLSTDGSVLQIPRTKDKCYLYADPSINPNSNKINHYLKIVDFYLQAGKPSVFVIEPELGCYEPDIYFQDGSGQSICVEVQITNISNNKMQKKIDDFVKECGKTHNAKKLMICSDYHYKIKMPAGFHLIRQGLPKEIFF
jgi:hypothetical protein